MADPAPIDDRGLLLGDGLFETLLSQDGRLIAFHAHAERLIAGCAVLGLPAPAIPRLRAASEAALARAGLQTGRAAVRLTWTAGSGGRGLDRPAEPIPRLLASAAPSPAPTGPARVALSAVRRNAASPTSRLKSLAYLDNVLARREAQAAGADEALMQNTDGRLACAAAANLFWIDQGRLFTPALDCGVLAGIQRGTVLAAARRLGVETVETHAGPAALDQAQALFLTNSLIGVRPVSALGGRALADHPLVGRLAEASATGGAFD